MYGSAAGAARLCDFVGARIGAGEIEALIGRRINRQRGGSMPRWQEWQESDRQSLRRFAPLAERYGYEL